MEQTKALQAIKRANAAVLTTDPARTLSCPTQPPSASATYADSPTSSSSPSSAEPSSSISSLSPTVESSVTAPTPTPPNPVSDATSIPPSSLIATSSSVSDSSRSDQCQQPHTCTEDHRTIFVSSYQPGAADCSALETVVNDVNFYATAASDEKQPSPVSVQRTAQAENVAGAFNGSSDHPPSSQYGLSADRASTAARSLSRQCYRNRQSATSSSLQFDEEFEEEYVAMHEAIRRSLIEM
ncbi:mucin-5AC [Gracilaria domingensis]|nr:mucin-5AC [Gracilaria domingensis]